MQSHLSMHRLIHIFPSPKMLGTLDHHWQGKHQNKIQFGRISSSYLSFQYNFLYSHHYLHNIRRRPIAFMNHALFSSNRPKCSAHHATLLAITPSKHSTTHRLQTITPEIIHIHTITFLEQRNHRSYFLRVILFIRSALKHLLHHFNHSAFHLLVF